MLHATRRALPPVGIDGEAVVAEDEQLGHADDIDAERGGPELGGDHGGDAQRIEDVAGGRGEFAERGGAERAGGVDGLGEQDALLLLGELRVVGAVEQLGDGGLMRAGVLAQIEVGGVQPEDVELVT